jgi:uncharacterized protein
MHTMAAAGCDLSRPMARSAGLGWRHAHYERVLEERPALGFLEVHSENFFGGGGAALHVLTQARAHYDVSLHGVGLSLGSAGGLDQGHLNQLADLVHRLEPVRVSDHASFARGVRRGAMVHAADLLPVPFSRAALNAMVDNVSQVQDRLGQAIAVENLSAYVIWPDADFSEIEFLTQLARRSGCHLLVDVNNLVVNARNAAIRSGAGAHYSTVDCMQWLDALSADITVAEIHVAGHCVMDDIVIDDHGSRVIAPVWAVLTHAIERLGHVPVLVEWDTQVPALEVLLDEVATAERVVRSVTTRRELAHDRR